MICNYIMTSKQNDVKIEVAPWENIQGQYSHITKSSGPRIVIRVVLLATKVDFFVISKGLAAAFGLIVCD